MSEHCSTIDDLVFGFHPAVETWHMTSAERCAFVALLEAARPRCVIEIGTYQGGSLAVLARYAGEVIAIDPDPACRERLAPRHPNVTFVTGYSQEVLPGILEDLQRSDRSLEFVLVDGDHRRDAVRRDLNLLLRYHPVRPLLIVMHDSFNPACRQGIVEADWVTNPYVQSVEIDYVPGSLSSNPLHYRQMWGGLAVALLLPIQRQGELSIQRSSELLFQTALRHSVHGHPLHRLIERARYLRGRISARLRR